MPVINNDSGTAATRDAAPRDRVANREIAQPPPTGERTGRHEPGEGRDRLKTALLQSVIENMGAGVVVADAQERLLLVNKEAEDILGLGDWAPLSRWPNQCRLYQTDRQTPLSPRQLPLRLALNGEPCDDVEVFVRHPRRSQEVLISGSARPLRDLAGLLIGGVWVFRDLTQRWLQEQKLEESHRELTRAHEELGRAREALTRQEGPSALDEMTRGIAHDFNNAIVPILGYSELLLLHPDGLREEQKVRRYLEIINTAARDASEVVRRLGEFHRQAGDVVQRRGGSISASSLPARGAGVRLGLPDDRAEAPPCSQAEPFAPSGMRILLVEDDPRVRRVVEAYLTSDGHQVESCETGAAALARSRRGPFDLVISDRAMPEMNGDELARRVKQLFPAMPFILLTGFGDLLGSEKPAGVDLVVSKPPTIQAIRDAIRRVICRPPAPR